MNNFKTVKEQPKKDDKFTLVQMENTQKVSNIYDFHGY